MRELKGIQDSPDVMLAAPLLLIHAHNQCQTIDREAVEELETIVSRNLRSSTDKVSTTKHSLTFIVSNLHQPLGFIFLIKGICNCMILFSFVSN